MHALTSAHGTTKINGGAVKVRHTWISNANVSTNFLSMVNGNEEDYYEVGRRVL